eukprot:scaffold28185_cov121-Skeletonema_dohrnii-CCMP3373.AAC.3
MNKLRPPPPPPPPPSESKDETFIDGWLQQKSKQLPSSENIQRKRQQWYSKQCLFPTHITESSMVDTSPLLSLLHDHAIESDDSSLRHPSDKQTTVDEMRKIASLCATYKTTAIQNKQEFEYKRAVIAKERQSEIELPAKPPDHPEFTPLKPAENVLLAKIHGTNYNLCLARAVCPQRTNNFLKCWKSTDPRVVKALAEQGLDQLMCMEEREAVERCIGQSVQKIMKDIIS